MGPLYRGVSKTMDEREGGKLRAKGTLREVTALFDGKIKFGQGFVFGPSEGNAVRAQHVESGLYGNGYLSTTREADIAARFATDEYSVEGWVYVIDEDQLPRYGLTAVDLADPIYPDEVEVSLYCNGEPLPEELILDKYEVDVSGARKG